jgi:hypothetical protein
MHVTVRAAHGTRVATRNMRVTSHDPRSASGTTSTVRATGASSRASTSGASRGSSGGCSGSGSSIALPSQARRVRTLDLGVVFVARGDAHSGARALRSAEAALAGGLPVLNFPEGTTTSGRSVLPFRSGVFGLARRTAAPVVPIALAYDPPCWRGWARTRSSPTGSRSPRAGARERSSGSESRSRRRHTGPPATSPAPLATRWRDCSPISDDRRPRIAGSAASAPGLRRA